MTRLVTALILWLLMIGSLWLPLRAEPSTPVLAVVVAKGSASKLKISDLALIYRRKQLFWKDGRKLTPVNLPATHPLRRMFSERVLEASPEDLERYWDDMYFHGISPPFVLSSDEAVLRFVAQTPGAIGYVDYCRVDARAAVVLILTATGVIDEEAARARCAKTS